MKMNTQTSNRYKVTIKPDSYIPIFETYAKFRFFLAKTKDYISKPIVTKTKKNYTLLKSPHVNKKSREQYQKTKFKKSFQFQTLNPKLILQLVQEIHRKEKNRVSITITCTTSNSN